MSKIDSILERGALDELVDKSDDLSAVLYFTAMLEHQYLLLGLLMRGQRPPAADRVLKVRFPSLFKTCRSFCSLVVFMGVYIMEVVCVVPTRQYYSEAQCLNRSGKCIRHSPKNTENTAKQR